MALVFGQSFYSAAPTAELKGGTGPAVGEEDSDDEEYVYVSRLAEQIAAHAMLDEEDEPLPPTRQARPIMHYNEDISFSQKLQLQKNAGLIQDVEHPVSRFAAVWRDHGPSEWECFYTPSLHPEASSQASLLNSQLHHFQKLRGWTSVCYANAKQAGSHAHDTWGSPCHRKAQPFFHGSSLPKCKESIGTGVFLPKIAGTGAHYRRKAGLSSKSAYCQRGKCLPNCFDSH